MGEELGTALARSVSLSTAGRAVRTGPAHGHLPLRRPSSAWGPCVSPCPGVPGPRVCRRGKQHSGFLSPAEHRRCCLVPKQLGAVVSPCLSSLHLHPAPNELLINESLGFGALWSGRRGGRDTCAASWWPRGLPLPACRALPVTLRDAQGDSLPGPVPHHPDPSPGSAHGLTSAPTRIPLWDWHHDPEMLQGQAEQTEADCSHAGARTPLQAASGACDSMRDTPLGAPGTLGCAPRAASTAGPGGKQRLSDLTKAMPGTSSRGRERPQMSPWLGVLPLKLLPQA